MEKKYLKYFVWLQITLGLFFGGFQAFKMFSNTEGVSTSVFIFAVLFISLNIFLLKSALKKARTLEEKDTVYELKLVLPLYWMGLVVYAFMVLIMIIKDPEPWGSNDWVTTGLVSMSLLFVFCYFYKKEQLKSPYLKGSVAAIAKGVPQLLLAYKMYEFGGAGYSVVAIYIFHTMTLMRIFQLSITFLKNKKDKDIRSSFFSEIFNEATWIVVTILYHLDLKSTVF